MKFSLLFVLPIDEGFLSGGNLYNQHLLQALSQRALRLEIVDPRTALDGVDRHPEAVVVVDSAVLDVTPSLVRRARGAVLVLAHHLTSFESTPRAEEARSREDELLRGIHGFIATSSSTRNALRERFGQGMPILTVPPALAVPEQAEAQVPPVDPTRCLVVGNVIRRKGVLALLDRLAEQLRPEDSLVLHVVGGSALEPDYFEACRRRIAEHPLLRTRVELVGEVPPQAMPSWYSRCSIFVSASEFETYGMALAEARAFGLLILALRGGHVAAHLASTDHGLLFDSLPALADGLLELLRAPEVLHRRIERARATRGNETYTWEQAADALLEQLRSLPAHEDLPPIRPGAAEGP